MKGFDAFASDLERRMCPPQENLLVLRRVDSTNSLARRVIREYANDDLEPPRLWIFGYAQGAGRGRQGRAWVSSPGLGVYATLCLGRIGRDALEALPLIVAESLCGTLNRWVGGRCQIKWPNDLVIGGRKIGGILIESVLRGDRAASAIVGFGVNHGHDQDALPTGQATSLRREGAASGSLAETAAELALGLDEALARRDDALSVARRYAALSAHAAGDPLRCRVAAGEVVEGDFAGFDERGFLRLRTPAGDRLVAAGEVIES